MIYLLFWLVVELSWIFYTDFYTTSKEKRKPKLSSITFKYFVINAPTIDPFENEIISTRSSTSWQSTSSTVALIFLFSASTFSNLDSYALICFSSRSIRSYWVNNSRGPRLPTCFLRGSSSRRRFLGAASNP